MDPKDELINAEALKSYIEGLKRQDVEFKLIERPLIKAPGLGKHHVFFHPDYFVPGEWLNLVTQIKNFLSAEV
jgi:hypothetical protein